MSKFQHLLLAVPGKKLALHVQGASCWGCAAQPHTAFGGLSLGLQPESRQGTSSPVLGPEVAVSSHFLFSRSFAFLPSGLVSDFFLQMLFFTTVLSIDIRLDGAEVS